MRENSDETQAQVYMVGKNVGGSFAEQKWEINVTPQPYAEHILLRETLE